MRKLLLLLILAGMSLSCIRHSAMEERARKQIVVSLEDYIESYFPGNQSWRMEDLETVYTNDSLCVLQCSVFINDSLGKQVIRDYRYIYLLDMDLSRASHKPVFAENFLNVLCLTRKEIREGRRKTRRSGENLYDTAQGGCVPVQAPFDPSPDH